MCNYYDFNWICIVERKKTLSLALADSSLARSELKKKKNIMSSYLLLKTLWQYIYYIIDIYIHLFFVNSNTEYQRLYY